MDELYPILDTLDGAKDVILLHLLPTMCDDFDTMGASEAAAVRVPAYSLDGGARDVHQEQLAMVEFNC